MSMRELFQAIRDTFSDQVAAFRKDSPSIHQVEQDALKTFDSIIAEMDALLKNPDALFSYERCDFFTTRIKNRGGQAKISETKRTGLISWTTTDVDSSLAKIIPDWVKTLEALKDTHKEGEMKRKLEELKKQENPAPGTPQKIRQLEARLTDLESLRKEKEEADKRADDERRAREAAEKRVEAERMAREIVAAEAARLQQELDETRAELETTRAALDESRADLERSRAFGPNDSGTGMLLDDLDSETPAPRSGSNNQRKRGPTATLLEAEAKRSRGPTSAQGKAKIFRPETAQLLTNLAPYATNRDTNLAAFVSSLLVEIGKKEIGINETSLADFIAQQSASIEIPADLSAILQQASQIMLDDTGKDRAQRAATLNQLFGKNGGEYFPKDPEASRYFTAKYEEFAKGPTSNGHRPRQG